MNLIDSLRNDPKFTPQRSQKWFAEKLRELTGRPRISSMDMLAMHQSQLVTSVLPGSMYSFVYDPKTKNKLPYYDKFPLVLPFNKDPTSFIGLNMHYLKPMDRIRLLNDLMSLVKNDRYGNPEKLRMSWAYLNNASKSPHIATCVKRYLNGHVKSRFIKINPEDWALSCMLPTENWAKGKPY